MIRLAWLGKDPEQDGLRLTTDVGRRWIGPMPGENAEYSGDTGWRWFGSDGSAVACSKRLKCVGFDAAGYVAVVDGTMFRAVYRPDGTPLGWYDTSAAVSRTGIAVPTLAAALSAVGVDLPGLVERAGQRVPFAGGVTGDPHLLTGGGHRIATQISGDFDARIGDPQRRIQVRWIRPSYQPAVTITSAVAIATAGTSVRVDAAGGVTIGGEALAGRTGFQQIRISGGPHVGAWPIAADGSSRIVLAWPDGATLVMATDPSLGITVVMNAVRENGVRGIFGTGDPTGVDLVDRDGIALDTQSVLTSWVVPAAESLFADPNETVGYPSTLADVPAEATAFATAACSAAGVGSDDLAGCVFDVALTGDERFADGHAMLSRAATVSVSNALADRWPAMRDRAPASAQQLPQILETTPDRGTQVAYSVTVSSQGAVGFTFAEGCPGQDRAALTVDTPALRLFDDEGRPVSDRIPACGKTTTDELTVGRYRLVVAGPLSGQPQRVKVEVTVP